MSQSINVRLADKYLNTVPVILISLFILIALIPGCSTTSTPSVEVEESDFGHRVDGETDGRRTLVISPASGASDYDVSTAAYESVNIRIGQREVEGTPVELLVKGALPDACTELHGVNQTRSEAEVIVQIQSRRPSGALCATVVRPYRFYLSLDGLYPSGRYTLDLNGRIQEFSIQ